MTDRLGLKFRNIDILELAAWDVHSSEIRFLKSSQRMESSGAILWDFVDCHYVTLCFSDRS
jgi:hypothetical protein